MYDETPLCTVGSAWWLVDENRKKTRENRRFKITVLSEWSPLISLNSVCEILLRQVIQNRRRKIWTRKFCFFTTNTQSIVPDRFWMISGGRFSIIIRAAYLVPSDLFPAPKIWLATQRSDSDVEIYAGVNQWSGDGFFQS